MLIVLTWMSWCDYWCKCFSSAVLFCSVVNVLSCTWCDILFRFSDLQNTLLVAILKWWGRGKARKPVTLQRLADYCWREASPFCFHKFLLCAVLIHASPADCFKSFMHLDCVLLLLLLLTKDKTILSPVYLSHGVACPSPF